MLFSVVYLTPIANGNQNQELDFKILGHQEVILLSCHPYNFQSITFIQFTVKLRKENCRQSFFLKYFKMIDCKQNYCIIVFERRVKAR